MGPILATALVVFGVPTLYVAIRSREFRKFLAGAFFVSGGMQFYLLSGIRSIFISFSSWSRSISASSGSKRVDREYERDQPRTDHATLPLWAQPTSSPEQRARVLSRPLLDRARRATCHALDRVGDDR